MSPNSPAPFEYPWSNAAGAVAYGREVIESRGLDLASASLAFKSMHPHVPAARIEMAVALEAASFTLLEPPYTTDSVAKQMANQSGAFSWDGPVGNGLTLAEYRSRFRRFAEEKLFTARQLGLLPKAVSDGE